MTPPKQKSGQVAIFLVLILAGLALLFALNVDVFTSARAKTRLQNSADASALAVARWQGITLNLIGDLNMAHLAAICSSNENAIAGIVALQRKLAFVGPTIGFKAANDIAEKNGVAVSRDMTEAARLVAQFMDDSYRRMLDPIIRNGIRAGIDNANILRFTAINNDQSNGANGTDQSDGAMDPRLDPYFYEAVANNNFRILCVKYGGGKHQLPDIPPGVPRIEDVILSGQFGSVGIGWENGATYEGRIGTLVDFAQDCGYGDVVTAAGLVSNATLFARWPWCIYDGTEWRPLPDEFSFSRFPWLRPLQGRFNTAGGSATVRVEGDVALASLTAQTNFIAAKAAAKTLGSVYGGRVTDVNPPLVLPAFPRVRLVPFDVGAVGRYGMANLKHVKSILGIFGKTGGSDDYLRLLEKFRSEGFRKAAEAWYSSHGHNDADGCRPPGSGTERGGGARNGI